MFSDRYFNNRMDVVEECGNCILSSIFLSFVLHSRILNIESLRILNNEQDLGFLKEIGTRLVFSQENMPVLIANPYEINVSMESVQFVIKKSMKVHP